MRTAVCLYVRDEARDIAEWIAFHSLVGFDAIIIFDNLSKDGTGAIARRAGKVRDVRTIIWPWTLRYSQAAAYVACLKLFGREFDWIAFIDSDEFVLPSNGRSIQSVLKDLEGFSAVALNYAFFGSSGLLDYPNGLVIENFVNRAPNDFPDHKIVKSIVRPKAVRYSTVHAFSTDGDYGSASGAAVSWEIPAQRVSNVDYAAARVNHYATRSRAHWDAKVRRGYRAPVSRREFEFQAYDRNEVRDTEAAQLAPLVRAEILRYGLDRPS